MNLTKEQKNVIVGIMNGIKNQQVIKMGGYAGTGKTTVIQHLQYALEGYAKCAFTGKAANVLRKKKIDASTIHSLIYKPELDEFGNMIFDQYGSPIFSLAPSLDCDGIIVDESSMVSKELYQDLCSFGLPIIFVGDHGQLEPVGESVNLMRNPDFTLEKIHRNAGEIAHFAEHIRKGYIPSSFHASEKVQFIHKYSQKDYYTLADQIICAYNKTRVEINKNVRKQLGRVTESIPEVDDKVMCLKNNKEKGVFNGMQGIVEKIYDRPKNKMLFNSDNEKYELLFDPNQFNKEKADFGHEKNAPLPFDYAYCITAHKSQGDEWKRVMVIEQKCSMWDHKRWAYTAASRAKEKIIWVSH